MKNNKNTKVIKSYSNADFYKLRIYKDNRNKSGIYRWTNLITGKSYAGSAKSLSDRLKIYYSLSAINKRLDKSSSIIYSAILKYGYSNFSLDILEYCEPRSLIKREQYYLDLLNPKYNICKVAGSTLGKKHTIITKEKISFALKNRKLSLEAIAKLKGRTLSTETKT